MTFITLIFFSPEVQTSQSKLGMSAVKLQVSTGRVGFNQYTLPALVGRPKNHSKNRKIWFYKNLLLKVDKRWNVNK